MIEPTSSACPHLGLDSDRTLIRTHPDIGHRCYFLNPPGSPELGYQQTYCLTARHLACSIYAGLDAGPGPSEEATAPQRAAPSPWIAALPWAVLALALIVVAAVYARDLLQPPTAPARTGSTAQPLAVGPSATPSAARIADQPTPSPTPSVSSARYATPTPEPGGRIVALSPKTGDVGWWSAGDARGNHLGDSFLYAGYYDGKPFISALRFELGAVPRGAPIRQAVLKLTGLRDDRFDRGAGGTWSVQLLPGDALPDLARTDFQALFNAPASITLFPTLYPADLAAGRPNLLSLDAVGREWLARQISVGATQVIARIVGPAGGADTLFAWDSGSGPGTIGEGAQLVLSLGPAPATPPPLPTRPVRVATLTPTPANVMTAAAYAWTATAVAQTTGTYTPLPYSVVTPTPLPANLATVQAWALARGLPPVVPHTPPPANTATATALAAYATAVAATTGTFTPVPMNAVTPVYIVPTPQPENVLTAAAWSRAATVAVASTGTPTPWPYNALLATATPAFIVVPSTPTPANAATVQARAAYATALAFLVGTFTPLPPNAVTPTPTSAVTSAPPAIAIFACPDPRAEITSPIPGQAVRGKVNIAGVAVVEAFEYYSLEVAAGANAQQGFAEIARGTAPVVGGVLGVLDTAVRANGPYTLRLTVVDSAGNALPACDVTVRIQN